MNPRFRITVGSEPKHENLVGDLYFDDAVVCVITQELGFDAAEVEFFAPPTSGTWTFSLRDFDEAFGALKARLQKLQRIPDERA